MKMRVDEMTVGELIGLLQQEDANAIATIHWANPDGRPKRVRAVHGGECRDFTGRKTVVIADE